MGLISRVSSRTYRTYFFSKMTVSIRTIKNRNNKLLNREQMIVDITHGDNATPSKKVLREKLSQMYKGAADCVVVYGLQTAFGGGNTTGFANIYDNMDSLKKYEHRYRQVRMGLCERVDKKARQQRKQLKNRKLKVRGTKKDKVGSAGKK